MTISVICFFLLMSLLKNKLKLVTVVFQKYRALFSQIGNARKKKSYNVYNALKYMKLCLKSIKIKN